MTHEATAIFDLVVRVRVEAELLRVFWSAERAWPGQDITLWAEVRGIPDGTEVGLSIRSASLPEGSPILATATGTVENSRCVVDHTINWDDGALSELFGLGITDCQFCFDATIEAYALTGTSPPMFVPFEPIT
jgi:hypothetical protein